MQPGQVEVSCGSVVAALRADAKSHAIPVHGRHRHFFELHHQHHSHCHGIYQMGLLGTGDKADSTSVALPSEGRPQYTPELKRMIGFVMGVTGLTMADYLDPSADH